MKLREMRQKLGMSQSALAEALGVPQETISRWETHDPTSKDPKGYPIQHPVILKLALEHLRCKRRKK